MVRTVPFTFWGICDSNRDLQDRTSQHVAANLRYTRTCPSYVLSDSPIDYNCEVCWLRSIGPFRSFSTSHCTWASHCTKRPPRPGHCWDPRKPSFFECSYPRHTVASSRTTKDRRRRRWRWQQEEGCWRQWRRSSLTPLLLDAWLHWSRLTCMFAQEA